jgi:HAD superfamily hydrolase (TIGR01509 family)
MIKAISFDFGGVLFTEGKALAVKTLANKYDYEGEIVLNLFRSDKSMELRKGLISEDFFWTWAHKSLPDDYDVSKIRHEWYNSYLLDVGILEMIKKLKSKYNIIAFSCNIRERVIFLEKKYGFRKFFDDEVYSYEHQLLKPDSEFVKIMIKSAKCKPKEIVYIDDKEKFRKSAEDLGVNVIIHKTGDTGMTESELKRLGVGI